MQRGDVIEYRPVVPRPGQSTMRLIISANFVNNADGARVIGLHVVGRDPESLLAPAIGELGWAHVHTIEVVLRSRLGEQVGVATDEEMQAVDAALKAALALE